MRIVTLGKAGTAILVVLTLAGCITSTPATVSGVSGVIGDYLPGTKGKTKEDQKNIDLTVAGGCAGGIYTKNACARHTKASKERNVELKEGRPDGG